MFQKNNTNISIKQDVITTAFLKELNKDRNQERAKKEIKPETASEEIAEIISGKLLENIQKKMFI